MELVLGHIPGPVLCPGYRNFQSRKHHSFFFFHRHNHNPNHSHSHLQYFVSSSSRFLPPSSAFPHSKKKKKIPPPSPHFRRRRHGFPLFGNPSSYPHAPRPESVLQPIPLASSSSSSSPQESCNNETLALVDSGSGDGTGPALVPHADQPLEEALPFGPSTKHNLPPVAGLHSDRPLAGTAADELAEFVVAVPRNGSRSSILGTIDPQVPPASSGGKQSSARLNIDRALPVSSGDDQSFARNVDPALAVPGGGDQSLAGTANQVLAVSSNGDKSFASSDGDKSLARTIDSALSVSGSCNQPLAAGTVNQVVTVYGDEYVLPMSIGDIGNQYLAGTVNESTECVRVDSSNEIQSLVAPADQALAVSSNGDQSLAAAANQSTEYILAMCGEEYVLPISGNGDQSLAGTVNCVLSVSGDVGQSLAGTVDQVLSVSDDDDQSLAETSDEVLSVSGDGDQSLAETADHILSVSGDSNQSMAETANCVFSLSGDGDQSLAGTADPALSVSGDSERSLAETVDHTLSVSADHYQSLVGTVDHVLAASGNGNQSMAETEDCALSVSDGGDQSLAVTVDHVLAVSGDSNQSLVATVDHVLSVSGDSNQSLPGTVDHVLAASGDGDHSLTGTVNQVLAVSGDSDQYLTGTFDHVLSVSGDSDQSLTRTVDQVLAVSGNGDQSLAGTVDHILSLSGDGDQSLTGTIDQALSVSGNSDQSLTETVDQVLAVSGDDNQSLAGTVDCALFVFGDDDQSLIETADDSTEYILAKSGDDNQSLVGTASQSTEYTLSMSGDGEYLAGTNDRSTEHILATSGEEGESLVLTFADDSTELLTGKEKNGEPFSENPDESNLEYLKEALQKAMEDLEMARLDSARQEERAREIAEKAIALREQALAAEMKAANVEMLVEAIYKEEEAAVLIETNLKLTPKEADISSLVENRERGLEEGSAIPEEKEDLQRIQSRKAEMEAEALLLREAALQAGLIAVAADEDVANAMLLAEQAVAREVNAAHRVSDAEMALQAVEAVSTTELVEALIISETEASTEIASKDYSEILNTHIEQGEKVEADKPVEVVEDLEKQTKGPLLEPVRVEDENAEELKTDPAKEMPLPPLPKSLPKRSSRFFSASYFSFQKDGAELTPKAVFQGLVAAIKKQFPKVVLGLLVICGGGIILNNRMANKAYLRQGPQIVSIEKFTTNAKPLMREIQRTSKKMKALMEKISQQEVNEEETSLFDVLWLLLASVIFVPIFQKLPGGSPVLGYLAAGVLIGPYALSFIQHVHGTKAIAEFGVVFLLFNIGLELSVERLSSMKKYVFGLGSAQVFLTALAIGLFSHFIGGISGPASLVLGHGLALSSTAVVLQVLQERGEITSRHGRATFSVLLFQDLAVVVLLILIPLISPNSSKGGVGFQVILEALGVAAVKALIAISGIIAGGRLLLRPIYKGMAENHNAEIFAATTLLVVLGTSVLTARAGLSMALGAFLAGLLLAETEFALQVESDIAPYRGLLLGLFFMTVGMSIDPKLLFARLPTILGALCLLIIGKTLLVASVGRFFGLSTIAAVRAGLLLAPGGEFAFVAFGEAVNQGILTSQMSSLLFLVVGLSIALTPWLGAGGQLIASRFEQQDMRSLLPAENETDDLQGHVIICGFGRVGQIITQLLSERLIPFVALDIRSERVSAGRAVDQPVYFGDAGSKEVLHKVGAERASCAVIALNSPGANFRAVWTLSKYFPHVKTFVRAHDVDHGINLEKAGATAVVPETLEPSLQLAAAVLAQIKMPASEIASTIDEFRSKRLSELTELSEASGSSLGYGFSRITGIKAKQLPAESITKGKLNEDSEWRQEEDVVAT